MSFRVVVLIHFRSQSLRFQRVLFPVPFLAYLLGYKACSLSVAKKILWGCVGGGVKQRFLVLSDELIKVELPP